MDLRHLSQEAYLPGFFYSQLCYSSKNLISENRLCHTIVRFTGGSHTHTHTHTHTLKHPYYILNLF